MPAVSVIPEDKWLEAQREFIECKLELSAIAVKYGVKLNTLRQRATAHGWGPARRAYKDKIINAPPAMVAEVLAYAERPIIVNGHAQEMFQEGNASYLAEIPELTEMIRDAREKIKASVDYAEAQAWAGIYDKLSERKRILMGIPLPAPVRQRKKTAKGVTVAPVDSGPVDGSSSDKV